MHVIIILGSKGTYLRDNKQSLFFDAANVKPLDTTVAADVFAAALTVYLSKNYEFEIAVKYAIYAAGISTTRQEMPDSLVDHNTLEMYMKTIS